MSVLVIRLLTGEEIISDATIEDGYIEIKKPCGLQMIGPKRNDDGKQQQQLALVPLLGPFSKQESIKVNSLVIAWTYEPVDELARKYVSLTSGIIAPSSQDIHNIAEKSLIAG